ncbi:hypothetical protein SAMN05518872_107113 [Psychrobacillus sp. OK032]|nr:hypothetical protein SAMN05518872_107113 [Psychrobacillus sp. OK032]
MLTIEQVRDLKQKLHSPIVVTDKSVTTYIGTADGHYLLFIHFIPW